MKSHKKGFTLMELIVVLAILGILMGMAVPAYSALKEESRRKVCEANCATLQRSYLFRRALGKGETPQASLHAVLAENAISCPSGEEYETSFSGEELTIVCPIHGKQSSGQTVMTGLDVGKITVDAFQKLMDDGVFTKTDTVDSGAIGIDGSRSQKIEAALNEAGFSSVGVSWSIDTRTGRPSVCWTEQPIPEGAKAGDRVLVIRYNGARGTYTVGTVVLVDRSLNGTHYLGMNANPDGSFQEYKGEGISQTDATKKDFSQTYQIYQQAVAQSAK